MKTGTVFASTEMFLPKETDWAGWFAIRPVFF
jgi:hypothetical protein